MIAKVNEERKNMVVLEDDEQFYPNHERQFEVFQGGKRVNDCIGIIRTGFSINNVPQIKKDTVIRTLKELIIVMETEE